MREMSLGMEAEVEDSAHLLSLDVDAREPATEAWMRVIPSYNHFRSGTDPQSEHLSKSCLHP